MQIVLMTTLLWLKEVQYLRSMALTEWILSCLKVFKVKTATPPENHIWKERILERKRNSCVASVFGIVKPTITSDCAVPMPILDSFREMAGIKSDGGGKAAEERTIYASAFPGRG
mmetsp:Transcript_29619/g.53745  ORF Transcript_29619/g.53745 Transcript_29619/m.53745 type:complete len:115 (-) Transcript_29619:421-765(-)